MFELDHNRESKVFLMKTIQLIDHKKKHCLDISAPETLQYFSF